MRPRLGARLIGLAQAEAEYGLPYGTMYGLIKRGQLQSVRLPGVRRLYIDRRDFERLIETSKQVQS